MPGELLNRIGYGLVARPALFALGIAPPRRVVAGVLPRMQPHVGSRRWGFTHYNVVLPRLPEPHRFMACAVFVGQPAARAFDLDHAIVGSPRKTVTVATGTAVTAPDAFVALSATEDCDLGADGSHLRFGERLEIYRDADETTITVRIGQPGLRVELALTPRPEAVCWFARSPLYEHFGMPTPFVGTIEHEGRTVAVQGTASLEHARGVTPHLLLDRRVFDRLKLPMAFFAYHVVDLRDGRTLLLTHIEAFGTPLLCTAHIVSPDAPSETLAGPVRFVADPVDGRTSTAPDGRRTLLPGSMTWRVGDRIAVQLVPDTEVVYGIGTGWMGGGRVTGTVDGRSVDARAYFEHIDRRAA